MSVFPLQNCFWLTDIFSPQQELKSGTHSCFVTLSCTHPWRFWPSDAVLFRTSNRGRIATLGAKKAFFFQFCMVVAVVYFLCVEKVAARNCYHVQATNKIADSPANVWILYLRGAALSISATNRARHRIPFPHISGSEPSEL